MIILRTWYRYRLWSSINSWSDQWDKCRSSEGAYSQSRSNHSTTSASNRLCWSSSKHPMLKKVNYAID